jgi:hypothetical protein
MKSIFGRVLTGICGGLLMAGFNHWNSLIGWSYWALIAVAFLVCFGAAVLVEHRNVKSVAASPDTDGGLGSFNKAGGTQDIEISVDVIRPTDKIIGSRNETTSDQKIKIG